jgi:energy-coupling factor transporter ATP-binding protein EcfA2
VITRLVIDNFKAIEHLEIDLRPFQVFVGPNDSGKSTILQAFDLLGRSTLAHSLFAPGDATGLFDDRFERYLPNGDTTRTLSLEVRGTYDKGAYSYRIAWSAQPTLRIASERLASGQGSFHFSDNFSRSALSERADELPEIVADLRSFTAQFDPKKLAAPAALGTPLESDGTGLVSLVDDLLTASDRQPLFDLEQQLRRFSSFIGGVGTQPTLDKRGKELLFSLASTKRPISARQASAGLVLVTAYLALRYGTGYRRYLIEEPENGIHPHAAGLVMQVLRELSLTGAQVLITTHSPLLLNQVSPEDVLVVTRRSEQGIAVKPMVETKLFAERIRDFDLGELWYNIGEDELVAAS